MAGMKRKLSRKFSANVDLNKKALNIKRSWDEVATLLRVDDKKTNSKQSKEAYYGIRIYRTEF